MSINQYADLAEGMAKTEGIQPPPTPTTDYSNIMDHEKFAQTNALQGSMFVASQTEPDAHAKVVDLANKTNVPPELVKDNFEDVKQHAIVNGVDYGKLIDSTPKTATWLEDTNNMAVARDDIEGLQSTEQVVQNHSVFSSMYAALNSGLSSMYAQTAKIPAEIYDIAALPQNLIAKYAPNLKDTEFAKAIGYSGSQVKSPDWLQNNPISNFYDAKAKEFVAPEMSQSVHEEVMKGNYLKAGQTLAVQFVQSAPQQAALIVGMLGGYEIPSLALAGLQSGAEANTVAKESGVDPVSSTTNAVLHGVNQSLFIKLGTFGILHQWESAIAQQYGKEVSKQVVSDMFKTLAYSVSSQANEMGVISAAQDLTDYTTGVNPKALEGIGGRALDQAIIGGFTGGGSRGSKPMKMERFMPRAECTTSNKLNSQEISFCHSVTQLKHQNFESDFLKRKRISFKA